MNTACATPGSYDFGFLPQTSGQSEEAKLIVSKLQDILTILLGTETALGNDKALLKNLDQLLTEEEESTIDPRSYANAKRFIEFYPNFLPSPEINLDPDGEISFDWFISPRKNLSASISSRGEMNYAAIIGTSRFHGVEDFDFCLPDNLIQLIKSVYK